MTSKLATGAALPNCLQPRACRSKGWGHCHRCAARHAWKDPEKRARLKAGAQARAASATWRANQRGNTTGAAWSEARRSAFSAQRAAAVSTLIAQAEAVGPAKAGFVRRFLAAGWTPGEVARLFGLSGSRP